MPTCTIKKRCKAITLNKTRCKLCRQPNSIFCHVHEDKTKRAGVVEEKSPKKSSPSPKLVKKPVGKRAPHVPALLKELIHNAPGLQHISSPKKEAWYIKEYKEVKQGKKSVPISSSKTFEVLSTSPPTFKRTMTPRSLNIDIEVQALAKRVKEDAIPLRKLIAQNILKRSEQLKPITPQTPTGKWYEKEFVQQRRRFYKKRHLKRD